MATRPQARSSNFPIRLVTLCTCQPVCLATLQPLCTERLLQALRPSSRTYFCYCKTLLHSLISTGDASAAVTLINERIPTGRAAERLSSVPGALRTPQRYHSIALLFWTEPEQIDRAGSEIVKAIEHPVNFQNKHTLPIEHGHKSLLFITDFVYRLQHNTLGHNNNKQH